MMLWLNTTINSSALSGLLHSIKHLLNLKKTIPHSLNGESGHASQMKILNLFEFSHVLAA